MNELSQAQVHAFFENLKTAVYDKRLENAGFQVAFFIDADVAVPMIAGFEERAGRAGTEKEQLVRALMACGFFGTVGMLRPHAMELYDHISWRTDQQNRPAVSFRERANHYLEERGLVADLRTLDRLAQRTSSGDPAPFLRVIRDGGARAFIGLEAAMGPWKRRLRRLYENVITVSDPGPEMRELLDQHEALVNQGMEELRALQGASPYRSLSSDYNDACALGTLHWFKRQGEEGIGRKLIRFYTETGILRDVLLGRGRLAEQLVYGTDFVDVDGPTGVAHRRILRTPGYFLMRCRFSQLGFNGGGSTTALDEVIHGVTNSDILRLSGSSLAKALQGISIEGEDLANVISEFEDLTLIRNIWTEGRVPKDVLNSLPEWDDVVAVLTGRKTTDILVTRIGDIEESLRRQVDRIGVWMRDFHLLLKQTGGTARRGLAGLASEDGSAVEARLGMRRWGLHLDEDTQRRVVRALSRVEGGSVDNCRVCQDVATAMEHARQSETEAVFACTVLWALEAFSRLVEVLEALERNLHRLPVSLQLLSDAARLRGAVGMARIDAQWSERWERRVSDLTQSIAQCDGQVQAELKVGLGYVLFHLARVAEGWAGRDETVNSARERWRRASIDLGDQAKTELIQGTVSWALAVNHCLYVGLICGSSTESILDNHVLLRGYEKTPLWNARFDDTIGRYYIWRFHERISGRDPDLLEKDLAFARRYLMAAHAADIGDIAVLEHVAELERAQYELSSMTGRHGRVRDEV